MKFMNWNRGVGGGGAIDLVIHLYNTDFKAALEWLSQHFPDFSPPEQAQMPPSSDLLLPLPDAGKLFRVRWYLVRYRSLSLSLIDPLIESGKLYADNRGNAVFLLLGEDKRPVGAELRGTTQIPWLGLSPGSRKDLGYFSVSAPQASTAILCESAIDAMSCLALHPWCLCISTAGARPNPRWLPNLLERGYEIYCGFDADPTGDEMALAMMNLYPMVKRLRPSLKDWNDILRAES
jgi:hypothetical protein